jgi:hypothetical protein
MRCGDTHWSLNSVARCRPQIKSCYNDQWVLVKIKCGEFAPHAFRGPPDDIAATENENAERDPAIRGERDDAQPNHRYRNNHGQVVGAGVEAMSAATLSGIQNAGNAHQGEGYGPNNRTRRDRRK